jgi:hypothetical protein
MALEQTGHETDQGNNTLASRAERP